MIVKCRHCLPKVVLRTVRPYHVCTEIIGACHEHLIPKEGYHRNRKVQVVKVKKDISYYLPSLKNRSVA